MSTTPAISIVVALYNKEPYIGRCLESIRTQTFEDFEVIVVDDGSTDNGPAIVEASGEPRLRLISQENAGPGAARNRGIREATARVVSFIDADDEWMPEFLQHSLDLLESNPSVVAVVTGGIKGPDRADRTRRFVKNGVTRGAWKLPTDMDPVGFKAAIDFFGPGTVSIYRDVLEQYGGFYDKRCCNYGEDAWLWIQVAFNHEVYRDFTPLTWIHTEASQLGPRRRTVRPPWPFLLDPDVIWEHCPTQYHALWNRCLAHYALIAARRHAQAGDVATAKMLHERYDLGRVYGLKSWDYLRLRWGMLNTAVRRRLPFSAS